MSKNTSEHFEEIANGLAKQKFAPVYFCFGEEEYFTDKLVALAEQFVLQGAEPSFNLDVLYGPEVTIAGLVGIVKSFPVMASYRLVIVKEANKIKKDERDKLGDFISQYLDKPVPSTVLFFVQKEKAGPDKRSKFGKALAAKAVLFESKPLYDNQIPKWITDYVTSQKLTITPEAAQIIATSLGTDLKLIVNEISKILIQLKADNKTEITKNIVFEFIQIDKEFNVFELLNRVGARQVYDAHLVLDHMLQNSKANPPIVILGQLMGFFTKLAICKSEKAETDTRIAQILGMHPFVAKGYALAIRNYSASAILANLAFIQEADLALKGISHHLQGEEHILKILLYNILQRQ